MNDFSPFTRLAGVLSLLAVFFCLSIASASAADIGVVAHLSGEASALSADGKIRTLRKGSAVRQGDMAITGKNSQLDVRFSDESLVQLHPESRFRIDEYAYKGKPDGNEKGLFSLIKGGFRTITGMIGRINKNAYAVTAPTATIGIRGTEYTARLNKSKGLSVSVARGEIVLGNNAGAFSVSEGQRAFVSNANAAPVYMQSDSSSQGRGVNAGASSSVQIKGNTRIEAHTNETTAIAVGQGNKAANQAGVIGGD